LVDADVDVHAETPSNTHTARVISTLPARQRNHRGQTQAVRRERTAASRPNDHVVGIVTLNDIAHHATDGARQAICECRKNKPLGD
jgi:hypothetical protein